MKFSDYFKNRFAYISLIPGAALALWSYGTWLSIIFPLGSSRLVVAAAVLFLAGTAASFWLLGRIVVPGLNAFSRAERNWFWLACFLLGILLYFSTIDFNYFNTRYIYFLLPEQALQVRVGEQQAQVSFQAFSTSLGEVSFNQMKLTGWERNKQDGRTLVVEKIRQTAFRGLELPAKEPR
jgi:hypothetical protein